MLASDDLLSARENAVNVCVCERRGGKQQDVCMW